MTKPRIYFDIDKTMIDTKRMLTNIQVSLEKVGVPKQVFVERLNNYLDSIKSKTFFDPEHVIQELLPVSKEADEESLRGAVWEPANFSTAVFPEVMGVLQYLQPLVELGTFSQGVKYWQERKLELAKLSPFFSEELRIIAEDKLSKESIARIHQNAWIIDDKEEVVNHLRQVRPDLTVLRINHTAGQSQKGSEITSLTEIVSLLKL